MNNGDVDERLSDGGQRVTDVERAGNDFVFDQVPQFVERSGRGKRADAQRVEEIGDEADGGVNRPRSNGSIAMLLPDGGKPREQVEGGETAERNEEPGFCG